jgi:hypothetical protein
MKYACTILGLPIPKVLNRSAQTDGTEAEVEYISTKKIGWVEPLVNRTTVASKHASAHRLKEWVAHRHTGTEKELGSNLKIGYSVSKDKVG